jgi:tetratricopeptide (TPR) repeat protein
VEILETNKVHQFGIEFRANGETSTTVFQDEPMILSVSIADEEMLQAAIYNYPLKEQLRTLQRRLKSKHIEDDEFKRAAREIEAKMLKEKIYRFGGPMGWTSFIRLQASSEEAWEFVDWPLWTLVSYPAGLVAELDGSSSCYVEYGLDPGDNRRPLGKIQIRALAEIIKGKAFESNVVTVNFLKRKMPKAMREKEDTILSLSEYAFKRGLYDEARVHVQNILEANPNSIGTLSLLGDIEEKKRNISAALSAYEKALDEFDKQYPDFDELPDVLIGNIVRLKALANE